MIVLFEIASLQLDSLSSRANTLDRANGLVVLSHDELDLYLTTSKWGIKFFSRYASQLISNRADHKTSDLQLDEILNDVGAQSEPERNIQVPPPQVPQARLPEEPLVPQLQLLDTPKVLPLQVPKASEAGPPQIPQVPKPEVAIPKVAAKKPESAPQRTLRDPGALKPAVRFEDEFDGLGSKKTKTKT